MIWVRNKNELTVVATEMRVLKDVDEKVLGLMGSRKTQPSLFVLHKPGKLKLHSYFCADLIDVVGLDEEKKVVFVCVGWKPWTSLSIDTPVKWVLELPKGSIIGSGTQIGHTLQFCRSKK